jgi:hypothetical protein
MSNVLYIARDLIIFVLLLSNQIIVGVRKKCRPRVLSGPPSCAIWSRGVLTGLIVGRNDQFLPDIDIVWIFNGIPIRLIDLFPLGHRAVETVG